MNEVLIVGFGIVGHNLYDEIKSLNPDVYDKYKPQDNTKRNIRYNFAFIAVDTPYINPDCPCDTTEVINAINETDADIFIIKSTVLPGFTKEATKLTGKNVIFSPEYYGGTQHCNNFDFNFTILGGEKRECQKVVQLLQHVYDERHVFHITTSETAELTKYMENSWLATKVSFCIQFYEIASKFSVSYEELRELFLLDPRVNKSHTFVYKDKPYWDSHCLNKDVPAIAEYADASFLKAVIRYNDECKSNS